MVNHVINFRSVSFTRNTTWMSQEVSKWLVNGLIITYNLLIDGVYWGYNPLTNHLLTSWDIQVPSFFGTK